MRLVVLLALGADVRVPPERDARSGRVLGEWLVQETEPAAGRALELALAVKSTRPGTEVTLVHLGPPDADPWLRQALAGGCDRAVRVWGEGTAEARTAGKAVILAAAVRAAGCDLALAGATDVMEAGGQLGVLLAAHLGVPCVSQVVDIIPSSGIAGDIGESPEEGPGWMEMVRGLDRGYRERVEVLLPAVVTVSPEAAGPDAPLPRAIAGTALLAAQHSEIIVWDLADLGVPRDRVRCADRPLRHGRPRPIHPRLHHVAAPDPPLSAFDRIQKLVQGSVQHREGRIVQEPPEAVAEEIFRELRDGGWLDHLRSSGAESNTGSRPA